VSEVEEPRQDKVEFDGIVVDSLPGTWFRIEVAGGVKILATLSGKLRQNHIMILAGDKVKVETSVYDLSRGRISWRYS
jgi:translation initiation factor IF-1